MKKIIATTTSTVLLALVCYFYFASGADSKSAPVDREVASLLNRGNVALYKDYFAYDSFDKALAYDVDFNFWIILIQRRNAYCP